MPAFSVVAVQSYYDEEEEEVGVRAPSAICNSCHLLGHLAYAFCGGFLQEESEEQDEDSGEGDEEQDEEEVDEVLLSSSAALVCGLAFQT